MDFFFPKSTAGTSMENYCENYVLICAFHQNKGFQILLTQMVKL